MPRLLVADADDLFCGLYHLFFSSHGYEVETTASGLDCLTKLRQAVPDLLILDWHLPWGGADGLLAILREDPSLGQLPVFLTFAKASPNVLASLAVPPVVRTLAKPFSLNKLLQLIASEMTKKEFSGLSFRET